MLRFPLPLFTILALTACQGNQNKVVNVMGEAVINKVTLPESAGADGALEITVNVELNGCTTFQSFEVQQRTATSLKLLAKANYLQGVTCPAVVI
ncbi:hypothetical protein [Deinococcus sp.]|uniref:hypothetical protein n=1 Tax=Deinococcus sp. TaxID=47478 RepID=UPI003B5CEFA2